MPNAIKVKPVFFACVTLSGQCVHLCEEAHSRLTLCGYAVNALEKVRVDRVQFCPRCFKGERMAFTAEQIGVKDIRERESRAIV